MLILPPEITDKMWWRMCDANMDLPVPLAEADLSKPFVYERKWGVFYVPSGYHLLAMTILLSFQHNETNMFVVMEKLGIAEVHDAADY